MVLKRQIQGKKKKPRRSDGPFRLFSPTLPQTEILPGAQWQRGGLPFAFLSWGATGEDEEAGVKHTAVQFSHSVVSDCLRPHALQHAKPPCPSPAPGVYSNSYSSSRWCHPTISSSVVPFSSYLQSFPASGSFPVSQFFALGGQSIGVVLHSASAESPTISGHNPDQLDELDNPT